MPWKEVDTMSLREEFVILARQPGANIRELCRRFQISAKTGYKWIRRCEKEGDSELQDRSRCPNNSPWQTPTEMEESIIEVRKKHRRWGGKKIRAFLLNAGHHGVPAASTTTEVLRRNGLLDPEESLKHTPFKRYEHEAPNQLWQMDFKGYFQIGEVRCNPLSVLDDHGRFLVSLYACEDQKGTTVRGCLEKTFGEYGLPEQILVDNGPPWGNDRDHPYTQLTVWMMRLGIRVIHGRPYHPQTQGKVERFHRTLDDELLKVETFRDLEHCQRRFDEWREMYNCERPHEALGMKVPSSRHRVSERPFPEKLPPIEYRLGDCVRKVQAGGRIQYLGKTFKVGRAFRGYPIALRPTAQDGEMDVYFCETHIRTIRVREDTAIV